MKRGGGSTVVDQRDGDCCDRGWNGDGHEVLFERQRHAHQRADQNWRKNGTTAANTQSPADPGGAHRHRIELPRVGRVHDLGADGRCAGEPDQQEQHFSWHLVPKHRDRKGRQQEHADQHILDAISVRKPAASDGTDHGAKIQHHHESHRRAEAVARAGHQLGQPRGERVDHEQAHEEGDPEHDGAESTPIAEELPDRCAIRLVLVRQRESIIRLRFVAWLDPRHDLLQLVEPVLLDQERHRFRHRLQDHGDQQYRQSSGEEYRRPPIGFDQSLAEQRSEHAANRVAAEHQRHHRAANLLGRVLGHLRNHIGHHAADAHTGEEAHRTECHRVMGQSGSSGKDAEHCNANRDRIAPANLVGDGAEEDIAEHHAEQRRADHEASIGGGDTHLLHDRRQRDTRDGEVIAVEDDDHCAPEQHEPVKAVEASLVGQFVDINLAHAIAPWWSVRPCDVESL